MCRCCVFTCINASFHLLPRSVNYSCCVSFCTFVFHDFFFIGIPRVGAAGRWCDWFIDWFYCCAAYRWANALASLAAPLVVKGFIIKHGSKVCMLNSGLINSTIMFAIIVLNDGTFWCYSVVYIVFTCFVWLNKLRLDSIFNYYGL